MTNISYLCYLFIKRCTWEILFSIVYLFITRQLSMATFMGSKRFPKGKVKKIIGACSHTQDVANSQFCHRINRKKLLDGIQKYSKKWSKVLPLLSFLRIRFPLRMCSAEHAQDMYICFIPEFGRSVSYYWEDASSLKRRMFIKTENRSTLEYSIFPTKLSD